MLPNSREDSNVSSLAEGGGRGGGDRLALCCGLLRDGTGGGGSSVLRGGSSGGTGAPSASISNINGLDWLLLCPLSNDLLLFIESGPSVEFWKVGSCGRERPLTLIDMKIEVFLAAAGCVAAPITFIMSDGRRYGSASSLLKLFPDWLVSVSSSGSSRQSMEFDNLLASPSLLSVPGCLAVFSRKGWDCVVALFFFNVPMVAASLGGRGGGSLSLVYVNGCRGREVDIFGERRLSVEL